MAYIEDALADLRLARLGELPAVILANLRKSCLSEESAPELSTGIGRERSVRKLCIPYAAYRTE